MDFSDSSRSTAALLVGTPAAILPVFLAATGASLVPQVFVLTGLGLAALLLRGTGRVERFADALEAVLADLGSDGGPAAGPDDVAGPADGGVDPAVAEEFVAATAGLFTAEVVALLALTAVVAVAAGLVARSVATAAQVHVAFGALVERAPVEAAVVGAGRDWLPFVGYSLLQSLVVVVPTVLLAVLGGGFLAGAVSAGSAPAVALGLVGLLVGLVVWLAVVVVGSLLLLFVPQAIVVDDVGLFGAVGRNLRFLRAEPLRALAYVGVALALWAGVAAASVVLSFLNVGRVGTLLAVLAVVPWLALFKTALYVDADPPTVDTGQVWPRLRGAFARGGRELLGFVRTHPGALAVCTAAFAAGTLAGYRATAPYGMGLSAPEHPRDVFGLFPVDEFVSLAVNNWLVAVGQAFAGLAFGVPPISNLVFNGLLVGAVGGVGFELPVALALVLPHAVIEVPGLLVSGAVGVHLGRYVWRYLRGEVDAAAVAAEVRRAFYVLLALVPVFVVAAFVEAFLTPWALTLVG